MVTLPIHLFSFAQFYPSTNSPEINIFPNTKVKSACIAKKLLNHFNLKIGGKLIIDSELPEGKGLASSSADLVASAYAISHAVGLPISENLISELISEIEPSDGIMYPGIVSFYYKELKLIQQIGNLPSITIVAIDDGHTVNTLEYNAIEKFHTPACAKKYQSLLNDITDAIQKKDLKAVGEVSTESAIMNQHNNPKQDLQQLICICSEVNGLGVAVAHSGSFLGILLDTNSSKYSEQKQLCIKKIKTLNKDLHIFNSIDFSINNSKNENQILEKAIS